MDGTYSINVMVNFTESECGEVLEARLCIYRASAPIYQSYARDDGYCDYNNPHNTGPVSLVIPDSVELEAGDLLYVQVKASLAALIVDGESETYMTIHKES